MGALAQHAAIFEAEDRGGLAGEFVHRLLERQGTALAHPLPQQIRGQRSVTQHPHVSPGVGQTDGHLLLLQQVLDVLRIVVGLDVAEAALEFLIEGDVDHGVEGRHPPRLRDLDQTASDQVCMRFTLRQLEVLPLRLQRGVGKLVERTRPPGVARSSHPEPPRSNM